MEKNRSCPVSGYELAILRSFFSESGILQKSVMKQRSWIVGEIDDKSLSVMMQRTSGSHSREAKMPHFLWLVLPNCFQIEALCWRMNSLRTRQESKRFKAQTGMR